MQNKRKETTQNKKTNVNKKMEVIFMYTSKKITNTKALAINDIELLTFDEAAEIVLDYINIKNHARGIAQADRIL